jgi:hypothetical protein
MASAIAIPTAAFMIVIVTRLCGDVAFDLLRDFDYLALAAEARQYLDEAVQEDIARHEQEKKKQYRREDAARKVPGQKGWSSRRSGPHFCARCLSCLLKPLRARPAVILSATISSSPASLDDSTGRATRT